MDVKSTQSFLFIRAGHKSYYERRGSIMRLKLGKAEIGASGWILLLGLLVVDNMYANHCKRKSVKQYIEKVVELSDQKGDA